MTLRDLSIETTKQLASQCEDEFKEWYDRTRGRQFGTMEPLTPHDIFRFGFSKGITNLLLLMDNGQLKEDV